MAATAETRTGIWHYFRENPPTIFVGSLEFIFGGVLCICLFHKFNKLFSTLEIRQGQPLSYCDSVALSCKLVSALFAIAACLAGVIILRDCGCISIKLKHNAVKHYMCFGLSYFFYDIYAMFVVFKHGSSEKEESLFKLLINFTKSRLL